MNFAMISPRYRNFVLFVALAAMWGSAFPAIKAGLQYIPPILYAALRYELAGIVMLVYALSVTERWRPQSRAEWLYAGISGALVIGAYHAFLFIGQQYTTSVFAAIIVSVMPILTPGFARVILPDERLSRTGIIGLLVGFVGVVLVVRPSVTGLFSTDIGGILIFIAAACFALGSVLTQRIEISLPVETRQAWAMGIGGVLMHATSFISTESIATVRWTPEALGALAYLVALPSVAGFLIYFDLLDRLGSIEINLVSYVSPVFAALIGWLWLGEQLDLLTIAGFAVIFSGFSLMKSEVLRDELISLLRTGREATR